MTAVVTLGIAGGTGSGKTTVARRIVDEIGHSRVAYLDQDAYYKDLSHLALEDRREVNFDHPDAFDNALLGEHVRALKKGLAVEKPVYSYTESVRTGESHPVAPAALIIIEGILVLENAELRNLMDVKIFVDTEDDVRLMRRLRRDTMERGRSMEHVLGQYEATVRPMHLAFVLPSRRHADVVIPRGGRNEVAIGMVADALHRRLAEPTDLGE
ncbi:MAG: uridine kinase [Bradymonadia bacterium]